MNNTNVRWIITIILFPMITSIAHAKRLSFFTQDLAQKHEKILTEIGGRLTGSESEKKAAQYLDSEMKRIGLRPWNAQSYKHPFEFTAGTNLGKNNNLTINDTSLKLNKDYRPLVFSGLGDLDRKSVV